MSPSLLEIQRTFLSRFKRFLKIFSHTFFNAFKNVLKLFSRVLLDVSRALWLICRWVSGCLTWKRVTPVVTSAPCQMTLEVHATPPSSLSQVSQHHNLHTDRFTGGENIAARAGSDRGLCTGCSFKWFLMDWFVLLIFCLHFALFGSLMVVCVVCLVCFTCLFTSCFVFFYCVFAAHVVIYIYRA